MAAARRLNRGVVLLTTLLVLALLAALAWQMVGRHSLLIAQYRAAFAGDQALAYALGAETFARQILYQDLSQGGAQKDTLLEIWAQTVPPFEIDNGFLEVQMRDLHGCFNLNSVAAGATGGGPGAGEGGGPPASGPNQQRLRQLLRNKGLPEALADAWRDWVDADQDPGGFGAEDGDYLLNDPAYRTANRLAAHVSEFRLLKDFEPDMYDAIADSLCVLPTTELRLNVNTARADVLAALEPSLAETALEALTGQPRDYDGVAQFTQQVPELAGAVDALSVSSEYFEVSIRARVDDAQAELVSVLRREPGSGRIELVSRDLSRNFRSLFLAELDARETSP